jgi:arylsulfatase
MAVSDLPAVAASDRPNVLVIMADDMGYSDAGCYGSEIHTPNLDALAAGGLRYTQFYNTARCWPTRAALLTGYYAQQVGFDGFLDAAKKNPRRRPPWARLLPEYLRPLGYRSYISGKWHVDSEPHKCGFDRSYVLLDHDHNFSPREHTLDGKPLAPVRAGDEYYSTVAITDRAVEFLQEHAEQHADQPFFAYVAFTVPHFPLQALPEDIERYAGEYDVGWDAVRAARWQRMQPMLKLPGKLSELESSIGPPYQNNRAREVLGAPEVWQETPWAALSGEQRELMAAKMTIHAAMIDRMDREVGRIIDQLRSMQAYENTLVLFLSDNGASAEIMIRGDGHDPAAPPGSAASFLCLGPGWSKAANTPFRRHKTWVHEGGIATPLIAHWPAGIAARGELRTTPGHVIDLAPTILQLAGGRWPAAYNGRPMPTPGADLSATFRDDVAIERDCLWWLHEGNRAIRQGDWKLVAARDEPWQLFDLAHDRAETNDVAAQNKEKAVALAALWQAKLREFEDLAGDMPTAKAKRRK